LLLKAGSSNLQVNFKFYLDLTPPIDFVMQDSSTAAQLSDIVTSSYAELALHPRIVSNRGTMVHTDSWKVSLMFSLSLAFAIATSNLVFGFAAYIERRLWIAIAIRIGCAILIACLSFLAEDEWILWSTTFVCVLIVGLERMLKAKGSGKVVAPNDTIGGGGVFDEVDIIDMDRY
jgi:hypothetical protein